jgi:transcriptional regulator with XRE-family HTH domain
VQARNDAGLTQVQVAAALKRPQSFVSKYESGERNLDVVEFVTVCRALRVNACQVLEAVGPAGARNLFR